MRRGLLVAAAMASTLVTISVAQAFWQYRGHIADSKHSTIQMVVHHSAKGEARRVQLAVSGPVALKCANGSMARGHLRANLSPTGVRHHTFFSVGLQVQISGPVGNPRFRSNGSVIKGRVGREQASGVFAVSVVSSSRRRGCNSGRLHWQAHFVPRS